MNLVRSTSQHVDETTSSIEVRLLMNMASLKGKVTLITGRHTIICFILQTTIYRF